MALARPIQLDRAAPWTGSGDLSGKGHQALVLLAQTLTDRRMGSPGFRNCGGFMPRPTPDGVPVGITSPGNNVMK